MLLLPVDYHGEQVITVEDDMTYGLWTSGTERPSGFVPTHAAGAITGGDARAGEMVITTSGADDEFNSFWTANEIFEFVLDKPMRFIAKDVLNAAADENLDTLNLFVGCMEAVDTATEIQDAGVGPRLDSDMFGFFKPSDGVLEEDTWYCVSSFGALQQLTALTEANANNLSRIDQLAYDAATIGLTHELVAEWVPLGLETANILMAEVRFWIDGVLVAKHQQRGAAYEITANATEEMNFGAVVRTNAAEVQVAQIGYMKASQLR